MTRIITIAAIAAAAAFLTACEPAPSSAPPLRAADADGDGIGDATDLCPAVPGDAPRGCPAPETVAADLTIAVDNGSDSTDGYTFPPVLATMPSGITYTIMIPDRFKTAKTVTAAFDWDVGISYPPTDSWCDMFGWSHSYRLGYDCIQRGYTVAYGGSQTGLARLAGGQGSTATPSPGIVSIHTTWDLSLDQTYQLRLDVRGAAVVKSAPIVMLTATW